VGSQPGSVIMLDIRGLAKQFGRIKALDQVDLTIARGEICGLLGRNGAGKSTLLSSIIGLCRPDTGTIVVDGVDIRLDPRRALRKIAFASQDLAVYPSLSVRECLAHSARLGDIHGGELRLRVDDVAEALEIQDLLSRRVGVLSGGQQRRVHVGMAVIHRPPLLLLDEPTAGVDTVGRQRLLASIRDLAAKNGSAVCYSTHYLTEIESLGASVAIIDAGRIVARGNAASLIDQRGGSTIEVVFEGAAPPVPRGFRGRIEGSTMQVTSIEPGKELIDVLSSLGSATNSIRSVRLLQPSLESVFLALTGPALSRPADRRDSVN
jgi:ABC-2 type transport system ATP-binding protein